MNENEALETLAGYAHAFVNNVLYGSRVDQTREDIDAAVDVIRQALIKKQAETVGTYEI